MDEAESLCRTVAASPADDLPRLVWADWLEDRGETDYAHFVRAQVELDPLPPWHPAAVRARHHRPDLLTGEPWVNRLPPGQNRVWEWTRGAAFRRGFGHSVTVRDLPSFVAVADELFAVAPVGELRLPTAALSDWRDFFRQRWLSRVESIHFYGVNTPTDAILAMRESDSATGLTELTFHRTGGPAMPVLLEYLFLAPVGRRLKKLTLRAGPDHLAEWAEAFRHLPADAALEELGLVTMGLEENVVRLLDGLGVWGRLRRLDASDNPAYSWAWDLFTNYGSRLEALNMAACGRFGDLALHALRDALNSPGQPPLDRSRGILGDEEYRPVNPDLAVGLRRLDLSRNPLQSLSALRRPGFPALASLSVRGCPLEPGAFATLADCPLWAQLVELDLRDVRLGSAAVLHLTRADVPPGLAALAVTGDLVAAADLAALRSHYGEALALG